MKITKRQLKRIIKEEKRKILREGRTQEEALAMAIQDYVIALQDQMDFDSVQDFLPDVMGQVEDWFRNEAIAEEFADEEEEEATYRLAAERGQ
jgi:chemotaxis methyl-accepting protein methylase